MTSRREFLEQTAALGLTLSGLDAVTIAPRQSSGTFVDLRRSPDAVSVQTDGAESRSSGDRWPVRGKRYPRGNRDHRRRTPDSALGSFDRDQARPRPLAPNIDRIQLILGDAWERGYGDLEWRGFVPDRVMPWYVATCDGDADARLRRPHRRGGVLLLAGRSGRHQPLGRRAERRRRRATRRARRSTCATWSCRAGRAGESAFAALHAFCQQMCASSAAARAAGVRQQRLVLGLRQEQRGEPCSPTRGTSSSSRPPARTARSPSSTTAGSRGAARTSAGAGTWDRGNEKFPDMPALASRGRSAPARGRASGSDRCRRPPDAPDAWRLPRDRDVLDPTVPEVREKIADDIARLRQWGFELIKHDYSTFDIFGRWGFQMGAALTRDGWTFAEGPRAHDRRGDQRAVSHDPHGGGRQRSSSAATP